MLADLGPELTARLDAAKSDGVRVVVVNDGGDGELIQIPDSDEWVDFDPQKAVFSAKITAVKPG